MNSILAGVSTVCVLLLMSTTQGTSGHWWSLAREANIGRLTSGITAICDRLDGLSRNQVSLCKRYHSHMQFVSQGASNGITECQHQFRNHRWNCSTVNDSTVFGNVLGVGSREIAFTYAIASAAVVHEVTRACKLDIIENCGCSERPRPRGLNPDWNWKGCGDDTNYAYGFAKEFVDALERDNLSPQGRKAKARKAMNLHNNEAGRLTVVRSARPACKCHGVSGSCNMKTCWYQVPDFRTIGGGLRQAHTNAIEMRMTKKGQIKVRRPGIRGKKAGLTDLVFIESSPDYCRRNRRMGVFGTAGRECHPGGSDSCGLLCCGNGHEPTTITVEEDCHCKFQWCCTVRCQKCPKTITRHICN